MWAKLLASLLILTCVRNSVAKEAGSCENGKIFLPDASDCQKYYVCLEGKPMLMKCEEGKSYDIQLEVCTLSQRSTCYNSVKQSKERCDVEEQLVPNPANCSTYFQCDNGHFVLKPCPDGLHFSPTYHVCVKPEDAHCEEYTTSPSEPTSSSSTTEEPTETPTEEPTTPEPTTSEEPETSTTEAPTEGPTTESTTPEEPETSTTEEPETSTTEEPETSTTEEPTSEPTTSEEPETSTTEAPTEGPTTEEPTTTTPPFRPDCPSTGIVTIPNPYDCSTFYVCVNGFPALVYCPSGLYFDEYKESCVPKWEAHCADPTEQPTEEPTEGPTEGPSTTEAPTELPTEPDTTTDPNEPSTGTTEGESSAPTETNEPTDSTPEPTTQGPYRPDCPATGVAKFPNPDDCRFYYICIEGNYAPFKCPEDLWFDSVTLKCVNPGEAVCEGISTQEPPATTEGPTEEPSEPTDEPTEGPTDEPTWPTQDPTEGPTDEPTQPTEEPTEGPTNEPTEGPTDVPTEEPTEGPTDVPTEEPTEGPTNEPTQGPTEPTTSGPYEPPCPPTGVVEFPNPNDCKKYFICVQGHYIDQTCPLDLLYDAIMLSCVQQNTVTCYDSITTVSTPSTTTTPEETTTELPEITTEAPFCPPTGMYPFPNPEDCGSFYVCINGHQFLIECPVGEEFNEEKNVCQTPEEAHCRFDNNKMHHETSEKETCTEGDLSPNYEDCSTYFICAGGDEILMNCPPGLYFNEKIDACDDPANSPCKETTSTETSSTSTSTETTSTETSSTSTSTETTSTETSSTSTSTEGSTSSPGGPNCPAEGTTTLPNPDDCTSYYICVNGEYALLYCPPNYQFDASIGNCVPSDGTCDLITTTSKPYEPDCPSDGVTSLPNPFDCFSFYVCINGNYALINCSADHEFDPVTETCVPSDGSCDENPVTTSTSSTTEETTSSATEVTTTERTTNSPTETTASPTETTASPTETTASPTETTASPTTETTARPTETTTEQGTTPPPTVPGECTGSIPFPNPDDCTTYYVCDNGVPTLLPCPPGLHFSPDELVCDLPEHAGCSERRQVKKFKFNIFNLL